MLPFYINIAATLDLNSMLEYGRFCAHEQRLDDFSIDIQAQ